MTTTDLLARIEALPGEWQSPIERRFRYGDNGTFSSLCDDVKLDLHLRHIAERLAEKYYCIICRATTTDGERWIYETPSRQGFSFSTYALALISAAEEVSRG